MILNSKHTSTIAKCPATDANIRVVCWSLFRALIAAPQASSTYENYVRNGVTGVACIHRITF